MAEALDEKKRVLASVLDGKEAKDLDLISTVAARRGLRIYTHTDTIIHAS